MGVTATHQLSSFSSPVNGSSPVDANQVRGNDNAIRSSYNAHDADATIHLQTGLVASRPSPSLSGQSWLATDIGAVYLYTDTGSAWVEANYLRNTGGTVTGNVLITGTLGVSGAVTGGTYNGQTITSTASFTGSVTVASGLTVAAGTAALLTTTVAGDLKTSVGAVYVGTLVTTSVAAGEVVLANAKYLRGVNVAGTNTAGLIGLNGAGLIQLDPGGIGATAGAALTVATGLTVSAGGIAATGNSSITGSLLVSAGITSTTDVVATTGVFKLNAAVSKIVPGATSLSLRNNADNADNLLVTDAGAVTFRSTVGGISTLTATTVVAALTGNASTATALQTGRTINGTTFDGTANITVTAAAGTLTGATLNATVTASSLTSVGTLTGLTIGSGGSSITKVLSFSQAYDPPSIAAGGSTSVSVGATGVVLGDAVFVDNPWAIDALVISAFVTGADVVRITLHNPTTGAIDAVLRTMKIVAVRV